MDAFVRHPDVLTELNALAPEGCPAAARGTLTQTSLDAQAALEDLCFEGCRAAISQKLAESNYTCEAVAALNWNSFFDELDERSTACAELPSDSQEALADLEAQIKCEKWPRDSIFWKPDDKEPGDLADLDGKATCSIRAYDVRFEQDPAAIVKAGTCPEGTACGCPNLGVTQTAKTSELRGGTGPIFVNPGSALVASLFSFWKDQLKVEVLANFIDPGIEWSATLVEALNAIPFQTHTVVDGTTQIRDAFADFRCADSVGCWPQKPQKVKAATVSKGKACRAASSAKAGGSPVWFMPPPGMTYQFSWWRCKRSPCSAEDLLTQKVGFGYAAKQNAENVGVYNCQPLNYDVMSTQQQQDFVAALKSTGMDKEYPDEFSSL